MNITNDNNETKKLVGVTTPATSKKPMLQLNPTKFRSYFENILQSILIFIQRYNEFEYGDIDEEFKTTWMDKRPPGER